MQAIILAAGLGRRLGELTKGNTKCMVSVNGERLIDRMLNELSRMNLRRVVIVVGYEGQKLMDYIGVRYDGSLNIEYVCNEVYDKTNNIYSLALAKEKLQEDDTLLLESDLIFEGCLLDMLVNHLEPNLALVAKYEPWMDGTMVRLDADRNIVNFIPKKAFCHEDVPYYYKTVNIYKFSKEFSRNYYVPFLDAYCRVMGNNEYYEQVLRIITYIDKSDLKALPIGDKKWYEIDDIQDLDIAETIFAKPDEKLSRYSRRYGGYWRFPGLLDFCYLVNPFFPSVEMRNELKANFDVLLTEYPSGMSVNSLLAGKYFGIRGEYVCPGNGASELIKCLMENHCGEKAGVVYPTFEEYLNRLQEDCRVVYVPDNPDFAYNVEDLKNFFGDKKISTLLLINPDNPSGNFIPVNDVLNLQDWCVERGIRLIVDESFVDFSEKFETNTLLRNDIMEENPSLVVMKSISKSYGVPGLRLGIIASGDKDLIASMKREVAIWNINSFAEFYMQIFSKYEGAYKDACKMFIAERNRFYKRLCTVPFLRVIPSQANYFLCEVTGGRTSADITEKLLVHSDILIKDCSGKKAFGGRNYVRIAVRGAKDNDILVEALLQLV